MYDCKCGLKRGVSVCARAQPQTQWPASRDRSPARAKQHQILLPTSPPLFTGGEQLPSRRHGFRPRERARRTSAEREPRDAVIFSDRWGRFWRGRAREHKHKCTTGFGLAREVKTVKPLGYLDLATGRDGGSSERAVASGACVSVARTWWEGSSCCTWVALAVSG